jgi:uncharacterized protein (TIGR02246 family)
MLATLLFAVQPAAGQSLTDADKEEIRRFIAGYAKTHQPFNAAAAAAYYADDALRLPPGGQTIRGRPAIQKAFESDAQEADRSGGELISFALTPTEIMGTKDVASVVSTASGTFRSSKDASPTKWTGKEVKVLKKEGGQWKIAVDIWNGDQP